MLLTHYNERDIVDMLHIIMVGIMKKGFTLAEVLIALGIIGIVAAVTMPILIKNYQMYIYAVAFKKEYSTLQNTVNYIVSEDNLINCYITYRTGTQYKRVEGSCPELRNEIINKLNLTKTSKMQYKNKYP